MKARKILIGLFIVLVLLFVGSGFIARIAVSTGVKAVTGLRLEIRRLQVGLFQNHLAVGEMKLYNPNGFSDRIMVDLPVLEGDYDLGGFLRGQTHLQKLDLYLREMVVVKNKEGQLNLNSVTAVQKSQTQAQQGRKEQKPKPSGGFLIDELHLRVGKVIYKDYSRGGTPAVQEFEINIDEHYSHVTDPTALGALIVSRALFKTTIAQLAQFNMEDLNRQIGNVFQLPGYLLGKSSKTAGEAAGEAVDVLKKLLPVKE